MHELGNNLQLYKKYVLNFFVIQMLFIMFAVEFVKGALLITILPVYMGSVLGLSTFIIGCTISLQYIGDNVFRIPVGWVIDRIGYRWSMFLGTALAFVSVLIIANSTHFIWIVLASALLGIRTAPVWPGVITGTTEIAGDSAKATILRVVYMAWLSGVGLDPIVINFFVTDSYVISFRFLIAMMVAVALVSVLLPGKLTKCIRTSSVPEKAGKLKRAAILAKPWTQIERIKRHFIEAKASLNVSWLFFFAMFTQTFALGLLIPVITLYVRTVLHFTANQYSLLLFSGGAVNVLMLIPVGKLVDRWGARWFLHFGFLLNSVILVMFAYIQNNFMLYIIVGLLGLGFSFIIPAWNFLIASAIPSEKLGAIW